MGSPLRVRAPSWFKGARPPEGETDLAVRTGKGLGERRAAGRARDGASRERRSPGRTAFRNPPGILRGLPQALTGRDRATEGSVWPVGPLGEGGCGPRLAPLRGLTDGAGGLLARLAYRSSGNIGAGMVSTGEAATRASLPTEDEFVAPIPCR